MPTLFVRDGEDMATKLGPLFWGFIFNVLCFGMSLLQAFNYFRNSAKERRVVKLTAALMMALDTTSSSLIIAIIWEELVVRFGSLEQFSKTNPLVAIECYIAMCITLLAQLFFVYQLYHVKPGGRYPTLALYSIIALSLIAWAFGLACASIMLLHPSTPHYNHKLQITFGGSKGANTLTDIVATAMMIKYLKDARTGVAATTNLLEALCTLFMNRGLLVTIIQALTFVLFFGFESPQYWITGHFLLTKVYVNTFFALLSSRRDLREKHLHDSAVYSDSNHSTFASSGDKSGLSFKASQAKNDSRAGTGSTMSIETGMVFSPNLSIVKQTETKMEVEVEAGAC
ncbi:hypothetical protein HMN09_00562200 [Mycena chlorophos]|uniref:DUF6534 domain-containing protein n=1 Tax=Mycena chlorophos TaxID=658473 RepID=A0A8H6TC58_MYCCL|nr:hypothetical protein HMN09_00562200 [Mycena chlorophos]